MHDVAEDLGAARKNALGPCLSTINITFADDSWHGSEACAAIEWNAP